MVTLKRFKSIWSCQFYTFLNQFFNHPISYLISRDLSVYTFTAHSRRRELRNKRENYLTAVVCQRKRHEQHTVRARLSRRPTCRVSPHSAPTTWRARGQSFTFPFDGLIAHPNSHESYFPELHGDKNPRIIVVGGRSETGRKWKRALGTNGDNEEASRCGDRWPISGRLAAVNRVSPRARARGPKKALSTIANLAHRVQQPLSRGRLSLSLYISRARARVYKWDERAHAHAHICAQASICTFSPRARAWLGGKKGGTAAAGAHRARAVCSAFPRGKLQPER